MLPDIRHNEFQFSIPVFDIQKSDIEEFFKELKDFHENFYDCFHLRGKRKKVSTDESE